MGAHTNVEAAREAFTRRAWTDACADFATADRESPLTASDLERWAAAAYLVGRDAEYAELWVRAHQEYLSQEEIECAARCALWLAFALMQRGQRARAGGWLSRAQRLLDERARDCVECGYLLIPQGLQRLLQGDPDGALTCFSTALEYAQRFGDPDLGALARHSRGRVLIRLGEVDSGVSLLDEAMASVEAGDVSAMVAGDVYCSVIEGCMEIFDLRRAQEWTAALTQYFDTQPDLVPYRGQCLVHRAEIMQLRGAWPDAVEQAQHACAWLTRPPGEPAAGAAFYQQAELHRLRGEFDEAEAAYREANRWGKKPQPGLAQLRLAQEKLQAAASSIRQALDEARERRIRARLLPVFVEVMLATDDVPAARKAADELSRIAGELDASLLHAHAAQAEGAVLLAEAEPAAAVTALRRAWTGWRALDVPYEAARVRVLIGIACQELGDAEGAQMELEAARCVFEQLGAAPDLERLARLSERRSGDPASGLTPREVEVLRLVATGMTNRAIASELFISEKTVAHHVSSILLKLGLSTRAAATAYAYEHDLV